MPSKGTALVLTSLIISRTSILLPASVGSGSFLRSSVLRTLAGRLFDDVLITVTHVATDADAPFDALRDTPLCHSFVKPQAVENTWPVMPCLFSSTEECGVTLTGHCLNWLRRYEQTPDGVRHDLHATLACLAAMVYVSPDVRAMTIARPDVLLVVTKLLMPRHATYMGDRVAAMFFVACAVNSRPWQGNRLTKALMDAGALPALVRAVYGPSSGEQVTALSVISVILKAVPTERVLELTAPLFLDRLLHLLLAHREHCADDFLPEAVAAMTALMTRHIGTAGHALASAGVLTALSAIVQSLAYPTITRCAVAQALSVCVCDDDDNDDDGNDTAAADAVSDQRGHTVSATEVVLDTAKRNLARDVSIALVSALPCLAIIGGGDNQAILHAAAVLCKLCRWSSECSVVTIRALVAVLTKPSPRGGGPSAVVCCHAVRFIHSILRCCGATDAVLRRELVVDALTLPALCIMLHPSSTQFTLEAKVATRDVLMRAGLHTHLDMHCGTRGILALMEMPVPFCFRVDEVCPICFDAAASTTTGSAGRLVQTPCCGRVFHDFCLISWAITTAPGHDKCPLCREIMTRAVIRRLW